VQRIGRESLGDLSAVILTISTELSSFSSMIDPWVTVLCFVCDRPHVPLLFVRSIKTVSVHQI
jgi:hypothetical protein